LLEQGAVESFEALGDRADRIAALVVEQICKRKKVTPLPSMLELQSDGSAYEDYGRARAAFFEGRYPEAEKLLSAALHRDGAMARALALRAYAAVKQRRYPEALEWAKLALKIGPRIREVRLAAARAEDYADHLDAAIAGYRAVLEIAPGDAVAHSNLA